jgi:hypothetical protein
MLKEISQKVLRHTEFFELYLQEIRGYAQTILLLVPLTDKADYSQVVWRENKFLFVPYVYEKSSSS